jgi:hypothetical protein
MHTSVVCWCYSVCYWRTQAACGAQDGGASPTQLDSAEAGVYAGCTHFAPLVAVAWFCQRVLVVELQQLASTDMYTSSRDAAIPDAQHSVCSHTYAPQSAMSLSCSKHMHKIQHNTDA